MPTNNATVFNAAGPSIGPSNLGVTINTDNAVGDSFGRVRTSGTSNRFDCEFIYDKQPLLIDEVTAGGGTATHNGNPRDVTLSVVDANNGTEAALYSHYDIPYTPGNSQLVDITGTLDNAGIGGGTAFVFLRTSISGSVTETTYEQANWSGATSGVDWADSFILSMDFQSLKVGRIRFALVQNGVAVPIKSIHNDNVRSTGYWQRPSLPAYWRIYNDATYTYMEMGYGDEGNAIGIRYRIAVNASATMRAICSTVKSEGGVELLDLPGYPFSASNGTTAVTVSTTLIPVLSIRVGANINSLTNRGIHIPISYGIVGSNPMYYKVLYRPTLTGASWTAVDSTYSGIEYDVSASAFSGGVVVDEGHFATGRNTFSDTAGILNRLILSQGRTGTSDILTLAAVRTGSSDSTTYGSLKWKEIR